MKSLQEQLLKAGMVDQKKLKQVNKDKRKEKKQQHKSRAVVVDDVKEAVALTLAEKAEHDRQLNAQYQAAAERKAVAAQIKQLITMNRQDRHHASPDAVGYNFTDGKLIKKLYVSADIQQQLVKGRLAIVKLGDAYELVPAVVADKISQRDSAYVLSQQAAAAVTDEDDPYARYQIPDDLMW